MGKENKVSWTKEQQEVISARNGNVLVSAAAGSGKTAVLVERIITMITDPSNPVDIDHLLVVTFTNAAAAEMRERIGNAIEKKLEEEPCNMHLQKQATLVRNAQITTLHSFCQSVIRNNFNEIDLDPAFRIGDETELKLLKNDVLEEVFEEYYEKKEENFLELVECYSGNKTDQGLMDIVLQLHTFAMSYPWPKEWLQNTLTPFSSKSEEELENSSWLSVLFTFIISTIEALIEKTKQEIVIINSPNGPDMYLEAIEADLKFLEDFVKETQYKSMSEKIRNHKWSALSRKKGENVDEEKKEKVKEIRAVVKKAIDDMKNQFFFQDVSDMMNDMEKLQRPMSALIGVTIAFMDAYNHKKTEKGILDFNDLEHYALQILVTKDGERTTRTPVAEEYSKHFAEILVDEYQDSNGVQETILNSITKEDDGNPNLFMVGDVKQSIYKFRMARPELFMEKYNNYTVGEGSYRRIDLSKNFRSRAIVLESVNQIFEKLMEKSLGNIDYDESAALYVGNTGFPDNKKVSKSTEMLLCTADEQEGEQEKELVEEIQELNNKELEARMVAKRIRELVSGELQVQDKKTGELRNANFGDMVILLRTMSGWSETFLEILSAEGIPTYTDTQSGYFSAYEIRTILQYLKVIDNPRQDIPLAAVLRSSIGGFNSKELAMIRQMAKYRKMQVDDEIKEEDNKKSDKKKNEKWVPLCFYESLIEFIKLTQQEASNEIIEQNGWHEEKKEVEAETNQEGKELRKEIEISEEIKELGKRVNQFLDNLNRYREMVSYLSICELLEKIYEETGYYDYVSVMPNGNQRKNNLDLLVQKAIDFEATSLSSLFHFNRYIEKLHKYEVDFGEAPGTDVSDNAVRIMSIHKSKGLEFPVVFVSGMGKQFNNQDSKSKLVLDMDLGLGPDYVESKITKLGEFKEQKVRMKVPSLIKKVIQKRITLENLGEELRVLYVALTRPKEKLIMTGFCENMEKQIESWQEKLSGVEKVLDYFSRTAAKNYLDWVMPVILNDNKNQFVLQTYSLKDLVFEEAKNQLVSMGKQAELVEWDIEKDYYQIVRERLEERNTFSYPYENERTIKSKLTVSELKKMLYVKEEEDQQGLKEYAEEVEELSEEAPIPEFLKEKEEIKGADRGTLYHKLMECLSLNKIKNQQDIEKQIEELTAKGIFTEEEVKVFNKKDILSFGESSLGKRMALAEEKNKLWREAPFVIGLPAREVKQEWQSDELILVQGMIDAYFEEDEALVLMDYKTDKVRSAKELTERYHSQLEYYQKALEQITGKRVKEKIIYSFWLNQEINLE